MYKLHCTLYGKYTGDVMRIFTHVKMDERKKEDKKEERRKREGQNVPSVSVYFYC